MSDLADRLHQLADEAAAAAWTPPPNARAWLDLQAAFATELDQLADEAREAPAPPQAPQETRCSRSAPSARHGACDRPAGHKDECSWEISRIKRAAAEYEAQARRVPRLEAQVDYLNAAVNKRDQELGVLRDWKTTLDRRGLRRFFRQRQAEQERG